MPIRMLGKNTQSTTRPPMELQSCTKITLVAVLLSIGFLMSGAVDAFPAQLARARRHRIGGAEFTRCVFFVERTDHESWIRDYWRKRETRTL